MSPANAYESLSPRGKLAFKLGAQSGRMRRNGIFMMRPSTPLLRKALKRTSTMCTKEERQMVYSWLLHRRHTSRFKRHG